MSATPIRNVVPAALTTFSSIAMLPRSQWPRTSTRSAPLRALGHPGTLDAGDVVQVDAAQRLCLEILMRTDGRRLQHGILRLEGPADERRKAPPPNLPSSSARGTRRQAASESAGHVRTPNLQATAGSRASERSCWDRTTSKCPIRSARGFDVTEHHRDGTGQSQRMCLVHHPHPIGRCWLKGEMRSRTRSTDLAPPRAGSPDPPRQTPATGVPPAPGKPPESG